MIVSRKQLKQIRLQRNSLHSGKSQSNAQPLIQRGSQNKTYQNVHLQGGSSNRGASSQISDNSYFNRIFCQQTCKKQQSIKPNHMVTLEYFNRQNQISKNEIYHASQKTTLAINLSHRNVKQFVVDLPDGIDHCNINSLNFSQNFIKQILPTSLIPFQSLLQLNLSQNKIQKISFPYNKMRLIKLKISRNKITNLNLEHLCWLQQVDASNNELIFITLPQSLTVLNLDSNKLSNIYFIQKCQKIEKFSLNHNYIYDLNFNGGSADFAKKQYQQPARYNKLKQIQCSHNKICYLNGFPNIRYIQSLNLQSNQLVINRQNMNELLCLQQIKEINILENPLQGLFQRQTIHELLFSRLESLRILNLRKKQLYFGEQLEESQINQEEDVRTYQQTLSLQYSQQKPFRLFMDEQNIPSQNQQINQRQKLTKQWIYTLGQDNQQNQPQDDSKIFELMTDQMQHQQVKMQLTQYLRQDKKGFLNRCRDKGKDICNDEVLLGLQSQFMGNRKNVELHLELIGQQEQNYIGGLLDYPGRNIMKMLLQMSFVPPQAIKYTPDSLISSKRLDEDDDQYILFYRLFQKKGGILYLKKIYLLEQNDVVYQRGDQYTEEEYSLSFFVHQNVNLIYQKMHRTNCLLTDALKQMKPTMANIRIQNYFSPVPSSFECHHIVIRNLTKKTSAFESRNIAPVCYLVQTKKI